MLANLVLNKTASYDTNDICETVKESLDIIHPRDHNDIKSIIIKPNLCYYWDYTTGQTTDPRVVSAIIDWIRERIPDAEISIVETDASAMKTKYAFKMLGYEKLASEKQVNLRNLSLGDRIDKSTSVMGEKITLPVNQLIFESDLLINVPTLKTHREIGFTCAMKNVFGLISKPRKYSYHPKLAETIVAINKIIKSDLVVVDGVIASGKTPKKMGVILTGDNAYSTDVVVADLIGYGASRVSYLKIAAREGFTQPGKINIIEKNTSLSEIKREFPKPNYFLDELLWKSELFALKLYAKIVGDVIPPVLE